MPRSPKNLSSSTPSLNAQSQTVLNPSHNTAEDLTALWGHVLDILRQALPLPTIEIWLQPLRLVAVEGERVTLASPSAFNQNWVKRQCLVKIQEAFQTVLSSPEPFEVDVVLDINNANGDADLAASSENTDDPMMPDSGSASRPPLHRGPERVSPPSPRSAYGNRVDGLNPRYRFDQFVVGEHNRFAHAAAVAVANTPGEGYNPLFLYGGVGLGKTHLMQAIGHQIQAKHPDYVIRYATTEQFTNELIHAIASKSTKQFRERYRRIDVLILDDIQFLEGKDRTQEEIFHTFNALHESHKQIILSSDRPPERLSRLEDRLRSRFACGLIADIQRPDFETRVAILHEKASRLKLKLPVEVLQYVADSFPENIRELEGALNKLSAFSMLSGSDALTLDAVKSLIGRRFDINRLTLDDILEHVARYYKISALDLKSPLRSKYVSNIRQIAIYILRELTDASYPQIGLLLGGRKHSTILYAYEKLKEAAENDKTLAQQLREVMSSIKQDAQV